MDVVGKRRGRPPAAESPATRDEILAAALRAFAERGYDGMSVRELNARLGVSHNLVNRRFGSKAALWEAVVDRWFVDITGQLVELLDATPDGADRLERLRAFVVLLVELSAGRPELLRLMNIEGSVESERLDYICERFVAPLAAAMQAFMAPLVAGKRVRPVPATTMFFLLAHGAVAPASHVPLALRVGGDDPTDPDVVAAHARAVADLVVGGLQVTPDA
jgi:AcrR family transcriptional regulator